MFVLFRAVVYATAFVGLLLIYLPARVLAWTGVIRPAMEWPQIAGIVLASAGGLLALWCIGAFIFVGRGTPAPFDPPRRLVIRGPYRWVRNPMYMGAALALLGAALFYRSAPLAMYGCGFLLVAHLFVVFYEEPTLRRSFGPDYEAYTHSVRRWLPGR